MRADIVIIGGGIVGGGVNGSSIACRPAFDGRAGDAAVIERDTACEVYATTRSPSIATQGVDPCVLSDHAAGIDPHAALMGFRHKARALGGRLVAREVFRRDTGSPPGRESGSTVADNRRGAAKR